MVHRRVGLYIDLLSCLVFFPLVITLLPMERWLMHSVSCVVALVVFVYVLYFIYRRVHLPQLFLQGKYAKALLVIGGLLLLTMLLTHVPFQLDVTDATPRQMEFRQALKRQIFWFFFLIVSGFSLSIELAFELFRQMLSKQEVEARKDKAELALYKSQINPHFLFNTLNSLYALVLCRSEHTESAFVKFSNILRYMYSQIGEEKISLEQEFAYISQYVDLQKLRLNRHTEVELKESVDEGETLIPPMILITFVENAFKYGTSSEEDCKIKIAIELKEGILTFETENRIMRHREKNEDVAIGLENCRKRLNLMYGDRYELKNYAERGTYYTYLKMDLK